MVGWVRVNTGTGGGTGTLATVATPARRRYYQLYDAEGEHVTRPYFPPRSSSSIGRVISSSQVMKREASRSSRLGTQNSCLPDVFSSPTAARGKLKDWAL